MPYSMLYSLCLCCYYHHINRPPPLIHFASPVVTITAAPAHLHPQGNKDLNLTLVRNIYILINAVQLTN